MTDRDKGLSPGDEGGRGRNGGGNDGDRGGSGEGAPPVPSSLLSRGGKKAKDLFGDCALVEIIHLHDCLRGAVGALQRDVAQLSRTLQQEASSSSSPSGGGGSDPPAAGAASSPSALTVPFSAEVHDRIADLERRVAGRFKVIWSVFRAHSAAEDEFIWPALQSKQAFQRQSSSSLSSSDLAPGQEGGGEAVGGNEGGEARQDGESGIGRDAVVPPDEAGGGAGPDVPPDAGAGAGVANHAAGGPGDGDPDEDVPCVIEQEEYEEDHADEERMFRAMDALLAQLREGLSEQRQRSLSISSDPESADAASAAPQRVAASADPSLVPADEPSSGPVAVVDGQEREQSSTHVREMARKIDEITLELSQHLMAHLEKEETQCMPLVMKHLTKSEIHDLVGRIMGKRSSELMTEILTMAVQNLSEADRDEMVRYMKQAMVGTFFERWLSMGGWMAGGKSVVDELGKKDTKVPASTDKKKTGENRCNNSKLPSACLLKGKHIGDAREMGREAPASVSANPGLTAALCTMCATAGRCLASEAVQPPPPQSDPSVASAAVAVAEVASASASSSCLKASVQTAASGVTTPQELERLIRAIASNPELTPVQKNTTIQGLRDSVWKSHSRCSGAGEEVSGGNSKRKREGVDDGSVAGASLHAGPASSATATRCRRVTPPSAYYKKGQDDKVELMWSSDSPCTKFPSGDQSIPLFSASELAPTYFDGATGAVLGCPHYARSCKLRHPSSGRLYTCRLCCEQEREMPMKDQDSPLDRYAVTEVLCMRCGALQPADDKCCNPKCESRGKPYAKYTCRICNLYDDSPHKSIYHCPFCNVCRSGFGLGIDYRHCMRCNACVSLSDDVHHCIPHRLQGNCPICHEAMFQSTEPLRGLKCGHVMHLSCFGMYMRGQSYTCPLCKKSVEDMKEYFALLDAAVRMQPMPAAYSDMISSIYCQDCGKTGSVRYHFVGCKCFHCGSYNTRELGRSEGNTSSSVQF